LILTKLNSTNIFLSKLSKPKNKLTPITFTVMKNTRTHTFSRKPSRTF
jgi:hypothetical protein